MRIAFVTNNYAPYSGGVVSSILASRQELIQAGHEVNIITLDFLGEKHGYEPGIIRIACPFKFTYNNNPMAVPWYPDGQLKKILSGFNPDIIHSHHPFLLGTSACNAARSLDIPIVFTYHSIYETLSHNVPLPQNIAQFAIKKLVKKYCRTVDCIIAPTHSIENHIRNQNIVTPIEIIPSGLQSVYLNHVKPIKEKKASDRFKLLVVSRFAFEKNIRFLIDLFTRMNKANFLFTLIGYGPEFEPLKDYAYKQLGLSEDEVVFMHRPEKNIIADYYRKADLFLFSSLTDVQPLTLIEAMAGATPVIALEGPGRDCIKNGKNGFVVSNATDMIATINHIAKDLDLHQHLQQGAWETAQAFAPHITRQQLVACYKKLIVEAKN